MRPFNNGPMSGAVARSEGSFLDRIGQGTQHKQAAASLVKLSSIPLDQSIQLFIDVFFTNTRKIFIHKEDFFRSHDSVFIALASLGVQITNYGIYSETRGVLKGL